MRRRHELPEQPPFPSAHVNRAAQIKLSERSLVIPRSRSINTTPSFFLSSLSFFFFSRRQMFTPDLNKHASVSSVCASAPGAPDQLFFGRKKKQQQKKQNCGGGEFRPIFRKESGAVTQLANPGGIIGQARFKWLRFMVTFSGFHPLHRPRVEEQLEQLVTSLTGGKKNKNSLASPGRWFPWRPSPCRP